MLQQGETHKEIFMLGEKSAISLGVIKKSNISW